MDFPQPGTFDIVDTPTLSGTTDKPIADYLGGLGKAFDANEFAKLSPPPILAVDLASDKGDYTALYPVPPAPPAKGGYQPKDPHAAEFKTTAPTTLLDHLDEIKKATSLWGVGLGKMTWDIESYSAVKTEMLAAQHDAAFKKLFMQEWAFEPSYTKELKMHSMYGGIGSHFGSLSLPDPLEPVSLAINLQPFSEAELASPRAFKQAFFDRAVEAMFTQQSTAHRKTGMCLYRSESGARCVVGWMIPDENYHRGLEGRTVHQPEIVRAMGLPASFASRTSPEGAFMREVQVGLHDNLARCYTPAEFNDRLLRATKVIAANHGLTTNMPVR